jgi:hypothetical protein
MRRSFIVGAIALWVIGVTVSAEALIIRDMCNETSGDGQGQGSRPATTCWSVRSTRPGSVVTGCAAQRTMPANNDGSGTYNCDKAVYPTSRAISGVLKGLLGARATVLEPAKGSGDDQAVGVTSNQYAAPAPWRGRRGAIDFGKG